MRHLIQFWSILYPRLIFDSITFKVRRQLKHQKYVYNLFFLEILENYLFYIHVQNRKELDEFIKERIYHLPFDMFIESQFIFVKGTL